MADKIIVTDQTRIIVTEPITQCSCSERSCHGETSCLRVAQSTAGKCSECERIASERTAQANEGMNS